jgi:hypothetical protein
MHILTKNLVRLLTIDEPKKLRRSKARRSRRKILNGKTQRQGARRNSAIGHKFRREAVRSRAICPKSFPNYRSVAWPNMQNFASEGRLTIAPCARADIGMIS